MSGPTLVHVPDVPPVRQDGDAGWAISEFRTFFGAQIDAATLAFHARFNPGASHQIHRHDHSPEISICLAGEPLALTAGDVRSVSSGTCRWIPQGASHALTVQPGSVEAVEILGLYVGAPSLEASGYVFEGTFGPVDSLSTGEPPYPFVALAGAPEVQPPRPAAWRGATVRGVIGAAQGCSAAVLTVSLAPESEVERHVLERTDAIIYVRSGNLRFEGDASKQDLRAGDAVYLPAGVQGGLRAIGPSQSELIWILPDVADLSSAGYREVVLPGEPLLGR